MKRMVITIEGAQGVGKSTTAQMLAEVLYDMGWNVTKVDGGRPYFWGNAKPVRHPGGGTIEIFTHARDIDGGLDGSR